MSNAFDEVRPILTDHPGLRNWYSELEQFRTRHEATEHVDTNPLYPLPQRLLQAIRREMPGWLSRAELAFEADLAELCDGQKVAVFFDELQTHRLLVSTTHSPIGDDQLQAMANADGRTPAAIALAIRHAEQSAQLMNSQLEAYVGWLLTDPTFRHERDELRAQWEPLVNRIGQLPRRPVELLSDPNFRRSLVRREACAITPEFIAAFAEFYARWNLNALVTWDLPEPLGFNLGGVDGTAELAGLADRPSIQLPPTLRLSARLPAREILTPRSPTATPAGRWQAVPEQQHQRYRQLFRLHFYRDVALVSRYGSRFRGNQAQLDEVFGELLGCTADNIKKLRHAVRRRR